MLTCFNLKPDYGIDDFQRATAKLTSHMVAQDLLVSSGSIGRRQRDTRMDTDSERNHEYFFIMSFVDRAQSDRAFAHVLPHEEPTESIHKAVYEMVADPVFICWEDLAQNAGAAGKGG